MQNLEDSDIEALRGTIWSLGVLRDKQAIRALVALKQHTNPLIAQPTAEALSRLEQA